MSSILRTCIILSGIALPTVAQASALASAHPNFTPFTAGGPAYKEISGILSGKKITLVRITAYFHQMNLPPQSVQPIGLEYFKYFVKDATGNMALCEKWIKRIQADEAAWTKQKATFPYLEINLAEGAKPVVVGGQQAYQGADVQCWEAMDFGPPLY